MGAAVSVTILIGDVRDRLRGMADESVDCVITSPPYWGLRDYDVEGQIGMEPTLAEHLALMVEIFDEVRRVLKPTGTVWLNYGDCYATAPNGRSAAETKAEGSDDRTFRDKPFSTVGQIERAPSNVTESCGTRDGSGRRGGGNNPAGGYLKPKDLCMLPNRLAIALQDAGWWVRSEIIWGKPNAMPDSSGKYRPSTAHEKIFLLTKSGDADVWVARDSGEISFSPDLTERCPLVTKPTESGPRWVKLGAHYDAGAVKLPVSGNSNARCAKRVKAPDSWDTGAGGHGNHHRNGREKGKVLGGGPKTVPVGTFKTKSNESMHAALVDQVDARLLRNFEQADAIAQLVPPDVMAWEIAIAGFSGAHFATFPPALVVPCVLAGCPAGGTVLDPFGGAGTTGLVAERLGREAVLIELNHKYAAIARDRLRGALCSVTIDGADLASTSQGGLFGAAA
ncbi:MAG: site-specific DNA-methyltransferase [Sphingomonadales bacterium]|nr:site-specific DNA-methyltransferase [Sphingomonadales bacterium]